MILCILKTDEKGMPTACETVYNLSAIKRARNNLNKKEIGF